MISAFVIYMKMVMRMVQKSVQWKGQGAALCLIESSRDHWLLQHYNTLVVTLHAVTIQWLHITTTMYCVYTHLTSLMPLVTALHTNQCLQQHLLSDVLFNSHF